MKRIIVFFIAAFISCKGGNGAGSGINKTDTAQSGKDTGIKSSIDSSAAALPTDTAPYKRNPNDSVQKKPHQ